jgi:23S rRNA pseudouridine2605 synthase
MLERLQKVLAEAGVASRRKCEEIITAGHVQVNGETVTTLGVKVDANQDEITVKGKPIHLEKKVYLLLNKPKGVITSASDPAGRKIVSDYLPGIKERVYPVGRLDYDTEGLLLLTNDGEFANLLTHPKHHVPRTYHATVKGVPHGSLIDKLKSGIKLEDGMTAPAEADYIDIKADESESVISITIYEGRNRQVRRMFEAISYPVQKLKRVQFGPLLLMGVPRGKFRHLTKNEVEELQESAYNAGVAVVKRPTRASSTKAGAEKPSAGRSAGKTQRTAKGTNEQSGGTRRFKADNSSVKSPWASDKPFRESGESAKPVRGARKPARGSDRFERESAKPSRGEYSSSRHAAKAGQPSSGRSRGTSKPTMKSGPSTHSRQGKTHKIQKGR